jgi:acetyl-CoA carboxylase biotin carboxyl carrier protein
MLNLESLISILEACKKNNIAELVVRKDSVEIRTVVAGGSAAVHAAQPQISIPAAMTSATEETSVPVAAEAPKAAASSNMIELTAPTPGVSYVFPGTTIDKKPLPKEGDIVEAGQVVALVEAMKMFNEVTAPRKARIAEIKVTNETLVKVGQVLMLLEPL